jgi:hypothetical protein
MLKKVKAKVKIKKCDVSKYVSKVGFRTETQIPEILNRIFTAEILIKHRRAFLN